MVSFAEEKHQLMPLPVLQNRLSPVGYLLSLLTRTKPSDCNTRAMGARAAMKWKAAVAVCVGSRFKP